MSNYKETTLDGTSYVRCNHIQVNNGMADKSIVFGEETVFNLVGGETISRPSGSVFSMFSADNALTEFDVINPETGASVGATMSYQDVYVALYSLYLHLATERDAAIAAAEAAAAEPAPEEPAV